MRFSLLTAALLICTFSGSAMARDADDLSWGKAHVPIEQYARDAHECADTTREAAVAIKPGTLRRLDAFSSTALLDIASKLSGSPDFNAMNFVAGMVAEKSSDNIARRSNTFGAQYVAMVQFDVKDELQQVLDSCLRDRGYVRIRLTAQQQKALSKLKRHSAERTRYLHAIDTDPAVVDRQRILPDLSPQ